MTRTATIVGSGPNGLAAAVTLARAGLHVRVLEAQDGIGGGARTVESTLPGFRHDLGSTVHPAAIASPFFRAFGLDRHVDWIVPDISYAHPLDGGRAAIAWHDLERTADALGHDGHHWRALVRPLVRRIEGVVDFTDDQLLRIPRDPVAAARFGIRVLEQATPLAATSLRTPEGRALFAGVLAHANTRMPSLAAAGAGVLLAAYGHAGGWGLPRGGARAITDALAQDLRRHRGTIETHRRIDSLDDLDWGDPAAGDLLLLDTSPRLLLTAAGLPDRYAESVRRYRYGPGIAKVDVALDGPVPWANPDVAAAATVHLGGTRAEILAAEEQVARGRVPDRPYVLAVQPSVVDPTRAPAGKGVFWAYTHVPSGSGFDATETIIRQVERFAPGFRDRILAIHSVPAESRSAINPAEIGGDILGGAFTLRQSVRRPVVSRHPWRTPLPGVYLASAATPPGPSVHGMAGWHAARTALHDMTGLELSLADLFGV
ncbi:NAD(P)/FAD-dependent oxidoreductase [Microbacterium sp. X-17]|uniref:phytoene desaturase family protein n=1 Tax=Microbacterium sp. X-17 TaxID=3144404 RepID=UPI0031F5B0F2